MKKDIISLLIVCTLSVSTLQVTAQSIGIRSNKLHLKNQVFVQPLDLSQNKFLNRNILSSNSSNEFNITILKVAAQNQLIANNLINKTESTVLIKPSNSTSNKYISNR